MKKRSVTIAGHRSSITLEDAFWQELRNLAKGEGISLNALITKIDETRNPADNLSSALRLTILKNLQSQISAE